MVFDFRIILDRLWLTDYISTRGYPEMQLSCLLLCHTRQYKKPGKILIFFFFSMPHLECNVWLCHMPLRADQLWLLNTLHPSERDPLSHFKRLEGREQSLQRGEERKNWIESDAGKPLCFTLVYSVYVARSKKLSPVLYVCFKLIGCLHSSHKGKACI